MPRLPLLPLLLLIAAPSPAPADEPIVIAPRVERPESTGPPRAWPVYSAGSGGNEIRNCFEWRRGWKHFVDQKAMPMVEKAGRVWVHNPGGVVFGEAMKFEQFTECRQQAALTGRAELALVSDWEEFSAQMSRVAAAGELVVYLGCPVTMPPKDGETDDAWFARARRELAPVLAIEPKPILGFDACYGHPADAGVDAWGRFGGPDGLVARVLTSLADEGYELLVEPGILASASWLRDRAGIVASETQWVRELKGRDIRMRHPRRSWGEFFKPSEIRGRQVRHYAQLWRKPDAVQHATMRATLEAGYDVAVGHLEIDLALAPPAE